MFNNILKNMQKSMGTLVGVTTIALSATMLTSAAKAQDMITVTDMAGRVVEVKHGVERVILGEGRMMYAIGILERDDPFGNIVGWKDDLIKFDPDAFAKYHALFPEQADAIQNFGSPMSGDFSIESAIAANSDLVILNLAKLYQAQEAGIIEKLERAGIPVIFIDFRLRPLQNTVPTMLMLGRVFAQEEKAMEFVDFYIQQMRVVTNVVDGLADEDRPMVFIDRAAGISGPSCCKTFGPYNYGQFVNDAGGINWGSRVLSGFAGEVSFEAILAEDPEIIIGTGANWLKYKSDTMAVLLGYAADADDVHARIAALASRPGWETLTAVQEGNVFSIYHQFYNGPYHFIAIQAMAKWFHPEAFEDLDPMATFTEMHDRFLAIDNSGIFWAQMQ